MTAASLVLVVDDDSRIRTALHRVLDDRSGFEVDIAEGGGAAIAHLGRRQADGRSYSVAFVDLLMPGMDGHETARRLWAMDPDLPVVFCSGSHRVELDEHLGRPLGPLVLKKPVSPIEVQQMALAMARSRELLEADRAHEAELAAEVEAETERLLAATEALEREAAQRAEAERRLATTERLRFVGDLASSLALELANPLQYVRDALVVVAEARDDLVAAQRALDAWLDGAPDPACARAIRERAERERLALVAEDLDPSIALCHEGVERVTEIVDALKQLSPPGAEDYALVDMGALVQTALTLTRNQFKYVADLDYEASPAPHIPGDASSLQQVLINLIVNAAHAMETGEAAERGRLTVRVREEAGGVAVSIGDTGGGIPDAVRERMFEPFVLHDQGGRPRHRAGARDRPLDRGGAPRRSPAVRHARG